MRRVRRLERRGDRHLGLEPRDRKLPHDGQRSARTVDSHISHLRRKLGDDAKRLETVYGIGYVWSTG